MTERDTYIENMLLELDTLDDQLSALEARAAHAHQEVRQACKGELARLRVLSDEALQKWDAMKASGEASWHQWVPDMDRTHDAFFRAFHHLKARL